MQAFTFADGHGRQVVDVYAEWVAGTLPRSPFLRKNNTKNALQSKDLSGFAYVLRGRLRHPRNFRVAGVITN
jgi:hypothetical protein